MFLELFSVSTNKTLAGAAWSLRFRFAFLSPCISPPPLNASGTQKIYKSIVLCLQLVSTRSPLPPLVPPSLLFFPSPHLPPPPTPLCSLSPSLFLPDVMSLNLSGSSCPPLEMESGDGQFEKTILTLFIRPHFVPAALSDP